MASRSKDLKVNIVGDSEKLNRELRKSSGALDKFGKQTRLTGTVTSKGFAAMRVGAVGATAAIGGLAIAGKKIVQAAIESEKSQARLQAQLKASGIAYGAHAKQIETVIQKHSQLAGLDDEDLQDAFTNIVRVTGDVDKSLRLTGLAADFARAKHMDVAKAGELVGKVAGGNIGVLSRYGIQIDKGASSTEALGVLQQKFAGQAEAYGKTTGGSVDRASVAFENLQETIGDALAPTVADASDKIATFVNEMSAGTGQGGRFVDTLKDIWSEVKPVVMWIGRATKNVAEFVKEHPNVGKLALAILGVGAAVKTLKFVSAVTGFSTLLSAGRVAAKGLKTILTRGGTAAGAAAAEGAASSLGSSMGPALDRHQRSITGGRSGGRWGKLGKLAGRAFGVAVVAGLLIGYREQIGGVWQKIKDDLSGRNQAGDEPITGVPDTPGGLTTPRSRSAARRRAAAAARRRRRTAPANRNLGGIIPGEGNQDTVPAMLTPGEFVIRKQVVEKFGPTFFSAINEGQAPQFKTSGGIIRRANKLDRMRIPYLYGGGHGTRDGFNRSGMDCSASVSYALGISPRVSGALMSFGRPGPGSPNDTKIYANPGHVFAVFNGRGWGTSRENPGGGPGWLSYNHRPGFTIRHLEDGSQKGKGKRKGDPQERVESGKQRRRERDRRSGGRGGTAAPVSQVTAGRHGGITGPPQPSYEQDLADADVAIAEAEAADRERQIAAQGLRRGVVRQRLNKVTAALRKRTLRPATRLRLTQERAQLLGELRSIDTTIGELRAPAGDRTDPNQALIDAHEAWIAAIEEQREEARRLAEEAEARERERIAAIAENTAMIKAQLAFADRVSAVTSLQAVRAMADVMSGQLGARVGARQHLPGSGALSRF